MNEFKKKNEFFYVFWKHQKWPFFKNFGLAKNLRLAGKVREIETILQIFFFKLITLYYIYSKYTKKKHLLVHLLINLNFPVVRLFLHFCNHPKKLDPKPILKTLFCSKFNSQQ